MSDTKLKIAVFIDFDNVEIGVKTTLNVQFDIGAVLEAIKERGEIVTKLAYGDWKRSGEHGRAMAQHAVRMVQRVMTPGGDKNGADINLALDALEMAFTHSHINAFVIVGGDSDFITLVEKLKQYDRKVFVVGGRAFTSQVMQKNCTEFIAYENVVSDLSTGSSRAQSRDERGGRHHKQSNRPAAQQANGHQSIEQAVPLVKRALQVLTDREVSPQLGLLKSTLLQLDSSFSERDYGVGSFREFADKLASQGLVSLKHQGRSTLVELPDVGGSNLSTQDSSQAENPSSRASGGNGNGHSKAETLTELLEQPDSIPQEIPVKDASLGDGVALVRRVLAETTTQPRWPMYPRQFKQFLRTAQPDFDERKYGSIADLMRACQKDGLLRLERDRQGALRVFASGGPRASVPHGWSGGNRDIESDDLSARADQSDVRPDLADAAFGREGGPAIVDVIPEVIAAPVVDAQVTAVIEEEVAEAAAPKARRARAKKAPAPKKAAAKRTRAPRKTEH